MARSIFVGDIHGCAEELEELFDKLALSQADRVYCVGDLVTRGPDPVGVLRMLRQVDARAVMGNHEQRMLAERAASGGREGSRSRPEYLRLARLLAPEDWAALEALPLTLPVPEHEVLIVHGGVVPGVPPERHEPWLLTHLRTLDEHGQPSEKWDGILWGERYVGPPHVVFGHNARASIQLHPWATGLDSGCVYGRQLTALVLRGGEPVPSREERGAALVSVQARRAYHAGAPADG